MNQHIARHPLTLALLPLLFTWLLLALAQPRELHNDDFQIFFQYCNGGTGAIPFSFYSGYLAGLLLQGLNYIHDGLNWHLILLQITGSLACGCLNFFAVKRITATPSNSTTLDYVRLLSTLAFLFFFNYKCILFAQYTFIGILCACAALFLLYDWSIGTRSKCKYSFASLLFICAYEMREQSVVPFFIISLFVFVVVMTTSDHKAKKRFLRGWLLFPALLAILLVIHASAFNAEPAWQQAMQYNKARGIIHDSRDNSGVDKTPALQQLGINNQDYRIFKSFTYLPGFCKENADNLKKVQELHQDQRKGIFGLDIAAKHGLLALGDYQYKEGDTPAQSISPWLPLMSALVLVLMGANRNCAAYSFPVLAALIVYFCLLFAMERVVGRVFHPVLYASTIWLFTAPLSANTLTKSKLICAGLLCIEIMAALFCLRDARHLFNKKEQPWKICASNPQNLYLTTSMQHLRIYPPGWKGVSLRYFATTNMLPIADGWCFYSPAYHAALNARGIKNPYAEICKPDTYIITQNNRNESEMLSYISTIHEKQVGTPLRFRKTQTVDKFSFWKAEAAD